jgi:capsid assembly protease
MDTLADILGKAVPANTGMPALRSVLAGLEGQVVAMGGARGVRALALGHHLAFGRSVADADIVAALSSDRQLRTGLGMSVVRGKSGSVAIITAHGLANPKLEYQPYAFSTFLLAERIRDAAADASISQVLLDIDSPGGFVGGTMESADAIDRARERKPVTAAIDSLAASAAFWIASQASSVVATRSASVGAIGVFVVSVEFSRALDAQGVTPTVISNTQSPHKTEGNPFEPLTQQAKDFEQKEVNALGREFIKAVAVGRGISIADVQERFGQGRVLRAPDALKAGMICAIVAPGELYSVATSPALLRAAKLETIKQLPIPRGNAAATARRRRLDLLKVAIPRPS